VCALAEETPLDIPQAFHLAALVEARLRFGQIEAALGVLRFPDRMQKRFADGLLRTLARRRPAVLRAVAALHEAGPEPTQWLDAYLAQRTQAWSAYEATARQVFSAEHPELVALAVLVNQLEGV
jgi:hypothetical protein